MKNVKKMVSKGTKRQLGENQTKVMKEQICLYIYRHVLLKFNTAFHILSTSHIKSKHKSDQNAREFCIEKTNLHY